MKYTVFWFQSNISCDARAGDILIDKLEQGMQKGKLYKASAVIYHLREA